MPNLGAILAIVAGAGGMLLSQVGNLIPSRKDFMASLRLKCAACIEDYAASHCFLLKQFMSAGVEDFDNVMRGDGRRSRDYFAEHSKIAIESSNRFQALKKAELKFRTAHFLLLLSTVALIILGILVAVMPAKIPHVLVFGLVLFAIELTSIFALYAIGDANES